jgi:hypothetical protein
MSDIVERLRADGAMKGYYAAPAIQREAADEIEKLRAAMHDLAGHVWRGDWDKLKPETRAALGEKE